MTWNGTKEINRHRKESDHMKERGEGEEKSWDGNGESAMTVSESQRRSLGKRQ
jgi:hypothetical protein